MAACAVALGAGIVVWRLSVHDNVVDCVLVCSPRGSIAAIDQAINIFAMKNNGRLPDVLEDLTRGTDDSPGLLKASSLVDNWNTPFGYSRQGKKFKITSAGPDKRFGTSDDITN